VERVATGRLIEAAAALDPAGRALLSLWVHRGLSDATMARLAGVEPGVIAARRLDLLERLSAGLGLPPYEVLAAIRSIASEPLEQPAPAPGPAPPTAAEPQPAAAEPQPAAAEPQPAAAEPQSAAAEPHPAAAERQPAPAQRQPAPAQPVRPAAARARLTRPRIAALLVLVVLIPLLVLLTVLVARAGSPGDHRASALAKPPERLDPLPGGPAGVRGELRVVSPGTLRLAVAGLPAPGHGHYEVWLYNSIADTRPLGALASGTAGLTVRLPAGATRFRWIDVSLQPPGSTSDSGQSVLRAANPADQR
jgi:hypothetical protein